MCFRKTGSSQSLPSWKWGGRSWQHFHCFRLQLWMQTNMFLLLSREQEEEKSHYVPNVFLRILFDMFVKDKPDFMNVFFFWRYSQVKFVWIFVGLHLSAICWGHEFDRLEQNPTGTSSEKFHANPGFWASAANKAFSEYGEMVYGWHWW